MDSISTFLTNTDANGAGSGGFEVQPPPRANETAKAAKSRAKLLKKTERGFPFLFNLRGTGRLNGCTGKKLNV